MKKLEQVENDALSGSGVKSEQEEHYEETEQS